MQHVTKQSKEQRQGHKIAEAIDVFIEDAQAVFSSVKKAYELVVKIIIWLFVVGSAAAHWLAKLQI